MILMIVCGLIMAAGLAAIVFRGGERFTSPPWNDDGGALLPQVARRVLWWANVLVVGGGLAGLCMAGAGGRLVMRLLAATSPEDNGRLTEAGQSIGLISLEGTAGFVAFGIAIGVATALLYGVLQRWLPAGRVGGAAFGLLLLIVLSTVMDPLRPENRDFQIVGPGWLSIAAFSALAIAHGMLVAGAASWLSRRAPLLRTAKDLRWYAALPLVVLATGIFMVVPAVWFTAALGVGWAAAALRRRFPVPGKATVPAEAGPAMESGLGVEPRAGAKPQAGAKPRVAAGIRTASSSDVASGPGSGHSRRELRRERRELQRRERLVTLVGRIALVVLAVACLPGFAISMAGILAADGR